VCSFYEVSRHRSVFPRKLLKRASVDGGVSVNTIVGVVVRINPEPLRHLPPAHQLNMAFLESNTVFVVSFAKEKSSRFDLSFSFLKRQQIELSEAVVCAFV
jgi:hypothetical protein